MKRKLTLHKHTLRSLSHARMSGVGGALSVATCPSVHVDCDHANSLAVVFGCGDDTDLGNIPSNGCGAPQPPASGFFWCAWKITG